MKLTYWYAACRGDSDVYSIRARTKREAVARKAEQPEVWGAVVKVTVEYRDGFDLAQRCLGEGRLTEEAQATT